MFSKGAESRQYSFLKCKECGCIFRESNEVDYDSLYDDSYGALSYSINEDNKGIKNRLLTIRDQYVFLGKHKIVGKLLNKRRPSPYYYIAEYRNLLQNGASFLDMGCGIGRMVYQMKNAGANVFGAEPYIEEDIQYKNGLVIKKKFLKEIEEKFDIVFLDNVLEHLESPMDDLNDIRRILKPGGICGLLFPAQGEMLEEYKQNSFIVQAPQHVCLHTEDSIRTLAEKSGFKIVFIKREPVEVWYVKSYLLQNNIEFHEGEDFASLLGRVPEEAINEIHNRIQKTQKNNKGDLYHVMLKKEGM